MAGAGSIEDSKDLCHHYLIYRFIGLYPFQIMLDFFRKHQKWLIVVMVLAFLVTLIPSAIMFF